MITTIVQSAQELVRDGVAATIVGIVNLAGIATVYAQGWRHRLKAKDETSALSEKVERIDATIKQTVRDSTCMHRMKKIEDVVRAEHAHLRDEMMALTVGRDSAVSDVERRVRITETWQARHNGEAKSRDHKEEPGR